MQASLGEQPVKEKSKVGSDAIVARVASDVSVHKATDGHARESVGISEKSGNRRFFIRPFKLVLLDLGVYFLINTVVLYGIWRIVPDMSVAMMSVVWVAIIAWRGGLPAGLMACFVIYFSNSISLHLPPNNTIPMQWYFNNRIPGVLIGFMQSLICGAVVGYISSLIHALKDEIKLRKKIQADLEQKIAELNAFGHTVAHDLKNPLMVINVSIGALVKEFEQNENPKTKKMMAFIQSGTVHMRNIIEGLLLFAGLRKIDSDKFVTFSVSQCVDDALKRMEYFIEHDNVTISKPDSWPSVSGYAPWITEVWVNYINNAIKYGGNPAQKIAPVIELGYDLPGTFACNYPHHLRFWVKDNGEGVKKEQAASLFKEFSRLHTSGHEGHGVGLSIVKAVVEKLNGTVGVESNEGSGSRFYFTLPQPLTQE